MRKQNHWIYITIRYLSCRYQTTKYIWKSTKNGFWRIFPL